MNITRVNGSTPPAPGTTEKPGPASTSAQTGVLQTGTGNKPVTEVRDTASFHIPVQPGKQPPLELQVLQGATVVDPQELKRDLAIIKDATQFFEEFKADPRGAALHLNDVLESEQKLTK